MRRIGGMFIHIFTHYQCNYKACGTRPSTACKKLLDNVQPLFSAAAGRETERECAFSLGGEGSASAKRKE